MAGKTGRESGAKAPVSADAAARQIETGDIKPVYLLYGEETYLQDLFLRQLQSAWLRDDGGGFNVDREDGKVLSQAQAVDLACQMPFFTGHKLVFIEEPAFIPALKEKSNNARAGGKAAADGQGETAGPQDGTGEEGTGEPAKAAGEKRGDARKRAGGSGAGGRVEDPLSAYLKQPAPWVCLVLRLRWGKPDRRSKLVAEIAALGGLVEAAPLTPGQIVPYLQEGLRQAGKQCPASLLAQISRQSGGLAFCLQELAKVIAYAGIEKNITADMLQAVLTPSLEANIFRLVDALGQRRRREALEELRLLLAGGESPFVIFAMMLRQFRLIFRAKACLQSAMGKGQVAQTLGLAPFVAEKAMAQSKYYSFDELERAMELFCRQDLAMKSSVPYARVLEDLVITLGV